ncbi:MAG: M48 family metalloprotease [Alcanivorax sp.]
MRYFKNRLKIVFVALALYIASFPAIAHAQRSSPSLVRDTEIERTLKEWASPIFKAANLNPKAVNIILVQSDVMNAFVAGGPNIFLYTGLISKTDNPGELIGVLAHETGHITGGHLIRTRDALERASYESIIGTILGVGAAIVSGDSAAVPAISMGGTSIAQRKFLAHSRVQESSADQAALTFFEKAKMNPTGLATFMAKLKSQSYIPENQQSEYVRTHPLVDNRIEALERRIANAPAKDKPFPEKWKEQHARMTAKLVGFITPRQIPWVYDDKDKSIAAEYARAIAAYRNSSVTEAIDRINALIRLEPNNPYFLELKGQMLVDFGRVEEALPYYRQATSLLPDAPLIGIALAHALIESNKADDTAVFEEAIESLQRALRDEPRSSRIHRLLATAYGRMGQENRAKIHLAEEAVLQRRFSYATQHAQAVLASEEEGSAIWIQANDIISFIKTMKNG